MQSAREQRLHYFEQSLPYVFVNRVSLENAFIAGDTNSPDNNREGHRGMAQVGDTVIATVIASEGFLRGVSRKEQQEALSLFKSKEKCGQLARLRNLHQLVQISERQQPIGPQPTVLKNTLAAIVGAVWIDSWDYSAVTGVMAWLGLVNCAFSPSNPDDHTMEEPSDPSPSGGGPSSQTELLADLGEFDFNAYVDPELFALENTSAGLSFENTLRQPQDMGESGAMAASAGAENEAWPRLDRPFVDVSYAMNANAPFDASNQPLPLAVNDQPPLETSNEARDATGNTGIHNLALRYNREDTSQATNGHNGFSTSDDSPRVDSMSPTIVHKSDKQITTALRKNGKRTGRTKASGDCLKVFKSYLSQENEKFDDRHDEYLHWYGHMMMYEKHLSSIDTPHQRNLAIMAVQFGSSSAMRLIKQAIASIRSSPNDQPSFFVRRHMPQAERLEAIYRLDITTAQLRLARWLHIHALYKDVTHDLGRGDEDGFIIVTNAGTAAVGPQGNPRNLERNAVARRMSSVTSLTDRAEHLSANARAKKLRRLGRRLQIIVHHWGIGALSLLDNSFTDTLLLALNDAPFEQLIKTMDRFEGRRICAVSNAAARAISMFMEDDDVQFRLRIEDVDESVLEQMPRLSTDMELLFASAD